MIPDLKFMEESFLRFNKSIFINEMPLPRFQLARASTFRGKFTCRLSGGKVNEPAIRLSLNFDLPEREWEDVMIHEMIHYAIALSGIREKPHGPVFRKIMKQINSRHGRDIRISYRIVKGNDNNLQPNADLDIENRPLRKHYVCIAILSDSRMGIFRAAGSRMFRVWDHLKNYSGVLDWRWICSFDPVFERIPKSLNGALYVVKDYRPWLRAILFAVELEKRGNVIVPLFSAESDLERWLSEHFPL